jgi:DNA-binding SARP family transcriptional activator
MTALTRPPLSGDAVTTATSSPPPPALPAPARLHVLGCFALRLAGRPVRASRGSQRLLSFLAVHRGRASRVAAATALWPEANDAHAAASLRSALWRLPTPTGRPLVQADSTTLALAAGMRVDLHEVERRAAVLIQGADTEGQLGAPELRPPELREDLLPDWSEQWLLTAREHFRQLRLRALEALCDRHRRAGRLDAALEAGLAAVAAEPLRESAHRLLVRVHLADGNNAEALRQYELYRRLLRTELALAPSMKFRQLLAPLVRRPHERVVADGVAAAARPDGVDASGVA